MPNLNLPTDVTAGVTATFEADVEAAWAELNRMSRDTGWRDVTSLLTNGWTAVAVLVRRIDDRVFWQFRTLDGSAATSTTLMASPAGFKSYGGSNESPMIRGASDPGYIRFAATFITAPTGFAFPASTSHNFDHPAGDAFPTTLPGTAV